MSSRKKKRGIARRTVDEQGNVQIKKFKRRGGPARFKISDIPALKAHRIPTTIIGSGFVGYGGLAYAYKEGALATSDSGLAGSIANFFQGLNPAIAPFLAGTIGFGLATLIGYTLVTQGLKVRKYGIPFRQLTSLLVAFLVVSSVLSPFLNDPGNVRQVPDDQLEDWDPGFDLSGLSSPDLSDILIDGLMGLLDGLDPDLATDNLLRVESADGLDIAEDDYYLFRWKTEEKWNSETGSYTTDDSGEILPFVDYDDVDFALGDPDEARKFRMNFVYFSLTSSLSSELVGPWNSELGVPLSEEGFDVKLNVTGDNPQSILNGNPTLYRAHNENPLVSASLGQTTSSGYIQYDAYWQADRKSEIAANSIGVNDIQPFVEQYSSELQNRIPQSYIANRQRTDELDNTVTVTGVSTKFGKYSLPALAGTKAVDYFNTLFNPNAAAFAAQRDEFVQSLGPNPSIFTTAVAVTSFVQTTLLQALANDQVSLDLTNSQPDASGGVDKGHFFYQALENDAQWGLKDFLPGYINMLRSLGVPARLVTGFAGGTPDGPQALQFALQNAHFWAEVLIPWLDDEGNPHFSWAIFNPIPIFSALANDQTNFQFGKNAMPTLTTIDITPQTGITQTGGDAEEYRIQETGTNFTYVTEVNFEGGGPAEGQTIDMRMIPDSEVDVNDIESVVQSFIDGNEPGFSIGRYATNESGMFEINGFMDFDGNMDIYHPNGTTLNFPNINRINIEAFLSGDPDVAFGVYALVGSLGLSANATVAGWLNNGTLSAEILDETTSFTFPGTGLNNVYQLYPSENYTVQARLENTDQTRPLTNETLQLMMFDETSFNNLDLEDITSLQEANLLNPDNPNTAQSLIRDGGTFERTTDNDGYANWTIQWGHNTPVPTENDAYAFIILWPAALVFTQDPIATVISSSGNISLSISNNASFIQTSAGYDQYNGNPNDNYEFNSTLKQINADLLNPFADPEVFALEGESLTLYMINASDIGSVDFVNPDAADLDPLNNLALYPQLLTDSSTVDVTTDQNGFASWVFNFGGVNSPLDVYNSQYYFFVFWEAVGIVSVTRIQFIVIPETDLNSTVIGETQAAVDGFIGSGYDAEPQVTYNITSYLIDTDLNAVIQGQDLGLYMFTLDDYVNNVNNGSAPIATLETFDFLRGNASGVLDGATPAEQATDTEGKVSWLVTFDVNNPLSTDDRIYVFVVVWIAAVESTDTNIALHYTNPIQVQSESTDATTTDVLGYTLTEYFGDPSVQYTVFANATLTTSNNGLAGVDMRIYLFDEANYLAADLVNIDLATLDGNNLISTYLTGGSTVTQATDQNGETTWTFNIPFDSGLDFDNTNYFIVVILEPTLTKADTDIVFNYNELELVNQLDNGVSTDITSETLVEYLGTPGVSYTINGTADYTNTGNDVVGQGFSVYLFDAATWAGIDLGNVVQATWDAGNQINALLDAGTVSQTSSAQGQVSWSFTIDFGDGLSLTDDIYYIVVLFEELLIPATTPIALLYNTNVNSNAVGDIPGYPGSAVLGPSDTVNDWTLTTTVTTNSGELGTQTGLAGVQMSVYIVDALNYNTSFGGARPSTYTEFETAILNDGTYLKYLNTNGATNGTGHYEVTLIIDASTLAATYYYLIVVIPGFEIFHIINQPSSSSNFVFVKSDSGLTDQPQTGTGGGAVSTTNSYPVADPEHSVASKSLYRDVKVGGLML